MSALSALHAPVSYETRMHCIFENKIAWHVKCQTWVRDSTGHVLPSIDQSAEISGMGELLVCVKNVRPYLVFC